MAQGNKTMRNNETKSRKSLEHCTFLWEISNLNFFHPISPHSIISPSFTMETSPVEWYLELNIRHPSNVNFQVSTRLCRSLHDEGLPEIRVNFSLKLACKKLLSDGNLVWSTSPYLFNFARGASCGGDFVISNNPDVPLVTGRKDNYKLLITCEMIAIVKPEIRIFRKPRMGPPRKYLLRHANAFLIAQDKVRIPVVKNLLTARYLAFQGKFFDCGNLLELAVPYSSEVVLAALRFIFYGINWLIVEPPPLGLYWFAREFDIEDLLQLMHHQEIKKASIFYRSSE